MAKINSILLPHPPRSSTATSGCAVTPRASAAFCSAGAFGFSSLAGVIVKFTTPPFRLAVVMVGRKPRVLWCDVGRRSRLYTCFSAAKTMWKQTPSFIRNTWKAQISNSTADETSPLYLHVFQKQHLANKNYNTFHDSTTRLVHNKEQTFGWMKEANKSIIGRCQSFCDDLGGNLSTLGPPR